MSDRVSVSRINVEYGDLGAEIAQRESQYGKKWKRESEFLCYRRINLSVKGKVIM